MPVGMLPLAGRTRLLRNLRLQCLPFAYGGHIVLGDQKIFVYHAKPRSANHGGEAWRGKTKLFWSPGTIWLPCDKGEYDR